MQKIASDLWSTNSSDGTVILDAQHDLLVTLNATASVIWQRLQRGYSVTTITRELSSTTGMDPQIVEDDIHAFLRELADLHLVCE
jgi:hypothetical protein